MFKIGVHVKLLPKIIQLVVSRYGALTGKLLSKAHAFEHLGLLLVLSSEVMEPFRRCRLAREKTSEAADFEI